LIDVHGVSKTFHSHLLRRPKVALQSVDLTIDEGEIFGFLGPNGAGKTTTIKILLGLIRPTSGQGTLLGQPFGSAEARARLGYLPDSPNFYRYLTARELLEFTGRLHGMNRADLVNRIDDVLDRVGLAPDARSRALRTYSRGMLQRTGIAAAILHRPKLVILDEPMNGLDPLGRADFRDLIQSLKREGATVFLSSHVLADIESTADRVAILKNGTILQCGNLNDILAADGRRIEIDFEMRAGAELDRIAQRMDGFHETGAGWTGHVDDAEQASRIVGNVLDAGGRLIRYQRRRASLEEFFVRQVSDAFPRPVGAPSAPKASAPSSAPSSAPGPSIHHRTPSGTSLDRVEEDAPR
jgi:ABC-2 type transport system ATP-binding protein